MLMAKATGFTVTTMNKIVIRFRLYYEEAPVTANAFLSLLPLRATFFHARVSGQEIWVDMVPVLDIIQENASVFTVPGEVVYGPLKPARTKTANCMGIYYGEGKGLDAANIFAKVFDEDLDKLVELGIDVWKSGEQELSFDKLIG